MAALLQVLIIFRISMPLVPLPSAALGSAVWPTAGPRFFASPILQVSSIVMRIRVNNRNFTNGRFMLS